MGDAKKLLKRIKMIVITKNMLYSALLLCVAGIFSVISILTVSKNKSMQAFSEYKPIFQSELTGIGEENTKQTKKSRNTVYKNIIN